MTSESIVDQALVALAERVLDQKLSTAYALASASCPNGEQQKGIDNLWMRIGGSLGTTHYLASCIAKAYAEGLSLAEELGGRS